MIYVKNYDKFINEEISIKKTLSTAALGSVLSFSNPAYSQINQINVPERVYEVPTEVVPVSYDSTTYFPNKVGELIGQELYFSSSSLSGHNYRLYEYGFFNSESVNLDELCDDRFEVSHSKIDYHQDVTTQLAKLKPQEKDVINKYYEVKKIYEVVGDDGKVPNMFVLELKERETGMIYFFRSFKKDFNFLVVGYFEKLEKKFSNSEAEVNISYRFSGATGAETFIDKKGIKIYKDSVLLYENSEKFLEISKDLKTGKYVNPMSGNFYFKQLATIQKFPTDIYGLDRSYDVIVLVFENEKAIFYIEYESLGMKNN